MRPLVKGFTLLEMMLVIAIIGIMATLAIPAYQDYVVRARVMEGLQMSMPARMAVNEAYVTTHEFPVTQQSAAYESPESSKNITNISIASGTGVITISYTPQAGGGTLVLTPSVKSDGQLAWDCQQGSLPDKFKPSICMEKSS
ncbi:MAG TPA: pilus assembly protein [Legionellales bacterium]|jgi:type IV pilus assembly protein PilA|nr:pilus assembly protein [Legionellales bacterium]